MNPNGTLPIELESTALVRFQDCDPFGHLNNARYIDYFMNARQDQLDRFYGFQIFRRDRPVSESWVVTKNQIAYLSPARLMEEVLIRTRTIHVAESSIVVEGVMLDRDASRVKALSWMELTYVSLATGRTARHPESLLAFLRSVLASEAFDPEGFNRRVQELKERSRRRAGRQDQATGAATAL